VTNVAGFVNSCKHKALSTKTKPVLFIFSPYRAVNTLRLSCKN